MRVPKLIASSIDVAVVQIKEEAAVVYTRTPKDNQAFFHFWFTNMAELSVMQAWLMLSAILLVFLSGLCWCFCCGTCGK